MRGRRSSGCWGTGNGCWKRWWQRQLWRESGTGFVQGITFLIRGRLDVQLFTGAIREVAGQKEICRTRLLLPDGMSDPLQSISERAEVKVITRDFSEGSDEVASVDEGEQGIVFTLRKRDESSFALEAVASSLLFDVSSLRTLVKQAVLLYEGGDLSGELGPEYADIAEWENEICEGVSGAIERRYWQDHAASLTGPLALESGTAEEEAREEEEVRRIVLSKKGREWLAGDWEAAVLGSWIIFVSTLTYDSDVSLLVAADARTHGLPPATLGPLTRCVPVKIDRDLANMTCSEFVSSLRGELNKHREFVFFYEGTSPTQDAKSLKCGWFEYADLSWRKNARDVEFSIEEARSGFGHFKLSLYCSEFAEALSVELRFFAKLFEERAVSLLAKRWQWILEQMLAKPEERISEIKVMREEERRQVVEEWNETEREYEKDRSIQELFEEQVKRTPEATAVIFEGAELSYEELNRRANQVGHYLRGLGVGAEERVGICVERSLEMVVGLLGILKAGGAYVPLDPEYPPERLGYMLEDARVPVLLTQERIRERLPESDARIVELDKEWEQIARESSEDLPSVTAGENAAYVMYTSGSTGRPKGVVMLHGVLANLIGWHNQVLRPRARTLQFASLSFDASFHEMFSAWCSGGTLIIVEESLRADFAALGGFIVRNKIEKATLPVVMLHGIAEEYRNSPSGVGSLREVITTGEQLQITPSVVDVFRRHPQCSLHNHYGPSETHVVTASTLPAQAESWVVQPPIGRPIANTQMYVLDLDLHPVPVGVAGELYIGGAGLGRGYLNQPGMTAEKFVANPYSKESGARMYRTGDLGRWRTDGELEFLGRIDEQVKIRGYRIEPGEIEAVLREQGGVREAAVVAREEEGQKRLVAYVVWEEGDGKPSVGELRKVLQGRLPEYMVPSAFVFLERLPLTANGKLDRRALPKPGERPEQGREYVGPRTAVEEILCGIWAKVLGLERVGVEDNFFELGGHSLLATQAVSQAKQAGLRFSLRELFEKQTVARLAQALGSGEGGDDVFVSTSKPFSMISEEDRRNLPEGIEDAYPLARLQGGMLYHSEYSPETPIYHDLFHYHLRTRLEIDALRQAIEGVLGRHAVLRTSFDLSSYGEPLQLVHARSDVVVELEDISDLSVTRQEEVLQEWVEAEKRRPFDLSQAGLLRFQIHRRTPETFQFTLSFHHAILDGWSTASLLTEIFRSYFSILEGKGKVIAAPVSCYREFVELERRTLQSEETQKYWAQQLSEVNIPRMPWKI